VILLTAAAIAAMNSGVKVCSTAGRGVDEGAGNNVGKGAGKDVGKGAGNNVFDAEGTMQAPHVLGATCQGWPASPGCGVDGAYMRVRTINDACGKSAWIDLHPAGGYLRQSVDLLLLVRPCPSLEMCWPAGLTKCESVYARKLGGRDEHQLCLHAR